MIVWKVSEIFGTTELEAQLEMIPQSKDSEFEAFDPRNPKALKLEAIPVVTGILASPPKASGRCGGRRRCGLRQDRKSVV